MQSALRPLLDRTQTRSHSSFRGLGSQPLAGAPSPEALKAVSLFASETVEGANIFTGEIPASPHIVSLVCFEQLLEVFLRNFFFFSR